MSKRGFRTRKERRRGRSQVTVRERLTSPYRCEPCDKGFVTPEALHQHAVDVHGRWDTGKEGAV